MTAPTNLLAEVGAVRKRQVLRYKNGSFNVSGSEGPYEDCALLLQALDGVMADNARLREAAEPFVSLIGIIEALPGSKYSDDEAIREYCPGAWPTVGDLRAIRASLGLTQGSGRE